MLSLTAPCPRFHPCLTRAIRESPAQGSPFGGTVERSETEGATAAGKTQADTALKDYQTRVADALREGDYERAYALYREYRNPELRAFKDFYALKTFTEYAGANGYGLVPDTAVGTE